ncbi:RtcB family protein [Picrophilus oshimae]|uniref:tRNA-splicing ligase RtcB n=1 Tax=Picrophilus torridus (strain ATCC 700027 / DSM 9790 / JCM 10055 / NBRC 100828 / KAW 2/3) TaxID=1122961 RepID=Q6L1G2_PICTO|nr:RtcB protein [Picrophilus oshimae DSM 9789]
MQPKMIDKNKYVIERTGDMKVPAYIYINDELLSKINDEPLRQLMNVASLPGIVKAAYAMPDIHLGYGFPIGGVAAFDYDEGIVSPGGVGYDINCGVSLIKTNISYNDAKSRIKDLIDEIFKNVPAGIDLKSSFRVNKNDMTDILSDGIKWAVSKGYGTERDIESTEENGSMNSNPDKVSEKAISRGINEVGSLGGGNHFLEIQKVDRIFDERTARYFGIEKDNIMIMVHTGSRGLGHQVATDYLMELNEKSDIKVKDRQLISAYTKSGIGESYIMAMNSAANFGFVNRQIILYKIRRAFESVFKKDFESLGLDLVYSLAHNMAKIEEHNIDNKRLKLIVHRKGATRAFPAGYSTGKFKNTGHPVLIPGDMGTASYVLTGNKNNMEMSFGSSCHGAGRALSRKKANDAFNPDDVLKNLGNHGIYVRAASSKVITEEAPGSYKDIDEVIKIVSELGMSNIISRHVPLGVMKG